MWKTIQEAPGYEVSDTGEVRRSMSATHCNSTYCGRVLIPEFSTGYARVSLRTNRKPKKFLVHRLVAMAFLEPAPGRSHVNHIDGNKRNNSLANLEWTDPKANVRHAWQMGLCTAVKGADNGSSKLTNDSISVIRDAAVVRKVPLKQIASVFNVSASLVSLIARNKNWAHVS